jgi:hypothetical protein
MVSIAQAENTMTSWCRFDYFNSTRTLDDRIGASSAEAGINGTYDIKSNDKFIFDINIRKELPDDSNKIRVVEGNWQHQGNRLDWFVGQQKISWGKADGINPTDFFTPHDYTVLQPFEEDQRLSILAVRADMVMDAYDNQILSLVVQPNFIESQIPMPKDLNIPERSPDKGIPQVGLRWSATGKNFDWSLCAFHGVLNTPLFSYDPTANSETSLIKHYAELFAVGADIARNFGRLGFRAEIAWLDPKVNEELQGIEPYAFLVAGVDRGEDDWNINWQLIVRYTPGFKNDESVNPMESEAAQQNAVNFGQQHGEQFGFTSRISANWLHQTLQAELLVIHYFRPESTMLRPMLNYEITDTDIVTIGCESYRGPDDSLYGQLDKNSTFFFEYKHYF